jgi:hypothetical protein
VKGKDGKAAVGSNRTTSLLVDALSGTGVNGYIDNDIEKQSAGHADEKATTRGLAATMLTEAIVKKEEAGPEAVTKDDATAVAVKKEILHEDVKTEDDEADGYLREHWCEEPPDVKFGCSKCRYTDQGCGRCRGKAGWFFSKGRGWLCTRGPDE